MAKYAAASGYATTSQQVRYHDEPAGQVRGRCRRGQVRELRRRGRKLAADAPAMPEEKRRKPSQQDTTQHSVTQTQHAAAKGPGHAGEEGREGRGEGRGEGGGGGVEKTQNEEVS